MNNNNEDKIKKILSTKFCSKENLINHLKNNTRVLKSFKIKKAFEEIDRADFVGKDYKCEAYEDYPIPIGYEQTISQPTTVAFMLELLDPQRGDKILDIGAGSGWTTALLASMVGKKGNIEGKEIIPELVKFGKKNLVKYNFRNATVSKMGKLTGVYDKILISASFKKELSVNFLNHLKNNGTIVAPVDNKICKFTKDKIGRIEKKCHEGFFFVPYKYKK